MNEKLFTFPSSEGMGLDPRIDQPGRIGAGPASEGLINILIVDDEPKNLTVLETILDDPSYRLVRAESPDEALLALVVEEFALIILDVRMPNMTGFELAQMIKERRKTALVPIIFLTAYYNEDQHVLEGYGVGAVDYLNKPVNAAVLRSKVAVFAELYRKSRECSVANRALLTEVGERRRAEEQLRVLNETLEQRVAERTEALHASEVSERARRAEVEALMDALKEADRRKNEFLATLAHELRNPLAPVRNAVQILQMKGPVTPELHWARDVIDRQMQAMTRLIDDLMDVSRINRNEIHLRRERTELARVVDGAIETTRSLIEQQGHTLRVSLPAEPVVLDADVTRLSQVLLNLLNNAAKYTEKGGHIDLCAERHGEEVLVSVRDTGIGIPADKLHSIFEMFSQVEVALARSQGGLGIGLSLVKRLVEMHGGTIIARSAGLGQGSEFVMRLPVSSDGEYTPKASGAHEQERLTSRFRVLVVDDNRDTAASLAMLLETMGNEVRTAHDGDDAVLVASEFRPHVGLVDIGLPKRNGYEAARAIRQEAWGRNMVLVAVTGWGQEHDKRLAREAGFDHHMVKPLDPFKLMKFVAELPPTDA